LNFKADINRTFNTNQTKFYGLIWKYFNQCIRHDGSKTYIKIVTIGIPYSNQRLKPINYLEF